MSSTETPIQEPTTILNPYPPSSSISSAANIHTIKVGPKEDPHGYWPHTLEADIGDLVVFEFYPRNHSVVQANWQAPCIPADGDYFFSGIKNEFNEVNGQVVGQLPTWNITIATNEPLFFYCTAIDSCIINGMVGVINPNETMTWESQYAAALDAPYMLLPGQPMPAEGENTNTGTSTTTPYTTSSSTASPETPSHSSSSLSTGAIAGIVVGSVCFVVILCVLVFVLGRNRVYKKWISSSEPGGGSVNGMRTAKWALSTPVGGYGSGGGRSDGGDRGGDLGGLGFGSQDPHSSLRQSTIIPAVRGGGYESGFGPGQEFGPLPSPPLSGSQVTNQSPNPGLMRGVDYSWRREETSELEGSGLDR